MSNILIRKIQSSDNQVLAGIIRSSLIEFNAAKPGTVYFDPTTDALYELFQTPGSIYFVLEENGEVMGGAGLYPTAGLPAGVCELVKLYLSKNARGKGFGNQLMEKCIHQARQMGYDNIYLESMPELKMAVSMYLKFGFRHIDHEMGNSGHTGCDIWMVKELI